MMMMMTLLCVTKTGAKQQLLFTATVTGSITITVDCQTSAVIN